MFPRLQKRDHINDPLTVAVFTGTGWSQDKREVKMSLHLVWQNLWVSHVAMKKLMKVNDAYMQSS